MEQKARTAEKLLSTATTPKGQVEPAATPTKKVRVYIDGCFDMMHFGHRYAPIAVKP